MVTTTKTSNLIRGRYYTIDNEKLDEILLDTPGTLPHRDAMYLLLSYVEVDMQGHQEWLDTASPIEIVNWLRGFSD